MATVEMESSTRSLRGTGAIGFVATLAPPPRLIAVRPADVLRAAIALLFVANLGRIPVLSTGDREAPLLVNDLCVAAFVTVGTLASLGRRSFRLDRVGFAALAFATIGGISALLAVSRFGLSAFQLVVSLAYLARWVLYLGIYLTMVNVVRERDVTRIWRTLESTVLAIAGFGIVQAIFLPGFAQLVYADSRPYLDWDPQGHRLVSTILEPNIAGAMSMAILLVELAQMSVGARVARWKPLVLFAALVLTLSRSAVVGLVLGIAVIISVYGIPKRLLRAVAAASVIALAALPKLVGFAASYDKFSLSGSAAARLAAWAMGLRVFLDHPWIGVGFNTYGFVVEREYGLPRLGVANYSTDGGLLFAGAMTGIAGLAVLLWMFSLVYRRCASIWRSKSASAEDRGIAIGTVASIIAICAHSVFVNSLFTTFVMEIMWVLVGLTFAVRPTRTTSGDSELRHAKME
ncbi:MAG TPA: O-antigen ligase family protein [Gemmatimonadaceae bacterium]|jgi:O-antigen ligase/polysaccharide polymerase Wzy-like membrane protein|nr:O-antigen ligase family protein [Gemmatimonadaceae bacterium]